MPPMGSGGRGNYSSQSASLAKGLQSQSPSLAKRGLQIRQQQDSIAPCHKNIWPNPMQGLPGVDIFTYLSRCPGVIMHLHSQVKTSPTCIPCKPRASPTFQRTSSPSWPTPPRWTRWTSMRTPPSTTHPSTTMALQVQSNVHLIWKMATES